MTTSTFSLYSPCNYAYFICEKFFHDTKAQNKFLQPEYEA